MEKWEYMFEYSSSFTKLITLMNKLGLEGWEVSGGVTLDTDNDYTVLLKRKIKQ